MANIIKVTDVNDQISEETPLGFAALLMPQ